MPWTSEIKMNVFNVHKPIAVGMENQSSTVARVHGNSLNGASTAG